MHTININKERINRDRVYLQRGFGAIKAADGTNKNFEKITHNDDGKQKMGKIKKRPMNGDSFCGPTPFPPKVR